MDIGGKNTLAIGLLIRMDVDSNHDRITAAGWICQTNQRGWTIYREPRTGRWHTGDEAIRKLAALSRDSGPLTKSIGPGQGLRSSLGKGRRLCSLVQYVPVKIRHAADLSAMSVRSWFGSRSTI